MDVINLISKPPGLPDGDAVALNSHGPRLHEFLQEMHREVFAGRDGLLTVGEMPGVTVEEARLFTDPARAEVDMVFQFEHVQLDQGPTSKWDIRPLRLTRPQGVVRALAGRASPTSAGTRLYWNNHDQPRAVSRFGDDGEHRVAAAKMLGTVLHLHRGTPYVYQGEELGMTNAPWATIEDFRDIESLNHYARGGRGRARRPTTCCSRCARWAATTRARRCSGTPARTPASRPASRGCRSTRTTSRSTPRPSAPTRTRSSTTTGG